MPNMTTRNNPNLYLNTHYLNIMKMRVVLESYLVYCIRCTETSPLVIMTKIS